MPFKKVRRAKIYAGSDRDYKSVSQIKLQGKWLEELGFTVGTSFDIRCENGKLTLTIAE